MAYTSMSALRTALAALEVDGIAAASRLAQAPTTLSVALPCSFPRITSATGQVITVGGQAGLRNAVMDFVIVVQAANVATNSLNLDAACALLDALDDALRANTLALGLNEWTVAASVESFGQTLYWTLVATLAASG